ncbi:D-alanyl-D-alanine carboxypeptidase family protein [Streptomyces sp. NRRL S-87]|uniref:D-alanyl-D-alanine carboxypeptidase family protein n=1 Tax=Streptomyces sp. NRRL S-87 TaxID=1463920 RepID=UPI0004BE5927|nr:serine hydrolase [Streptomyces sp. NRRL S-87]
MISSISRVRRLAAATAAAGALLAAPLATSAQAATAPATSAKGAFMMNTTTGATLYGKYADTRRPLASTAKIMTARVVLTTPGLDLDKRITYKQAYTDYANSVGGSQAYLIPGDRFTVRGLLNALLTPSGCDAAAALADNFGKGSTQAARFADFIRQMNAKAATYGLKNTHFDSFDGNSPIRTGTTGTYSTPREMAKLAQYGIKSATFRDIVNGAGTATAIAPNGRYRYYSWKNSNLLVRATSDGGYGYPGAIGIKTGTNTPAGHCLVFEVTRNGKTVIGVLLGDTSTSRYPDAINLLNWTYGSGAAAATQRANTDPIPDVLD